MTQRYIDPFPDLPYDSPPLAVHTTEQFFPLFATLMFDKSVAEGVVDLQDTVDANTPNANDRVIIFGYPQSGLCLLLRTASTPAGRGLISETRTSAI